MKKPSAKNVSVPATGGTTADSNAPGLAASEGYYLESKLPGTRGVNRIRIDTFPFRIGRGSSTNLILSSPSVSSDHAEIEWNPQRRQLRVRDLGSTNGTCLNGQRIQSAQIVEGDILHFADIEFRVGREQPAQATTPDSGKTRVTMRLDSNRALPRGFVKGAQKILSLIDSQAFVPLFQPIVSLPDRSTVAWEALTRGQHPDLPQDPGELFRIAAEVGLESEMSRAFRRKALKAVLSRDNVRVLFLNTHPEESIPDVIDSAAELRRMAPRLEMVFEVHEKTLVDADTVRKLKTKLAEQRIQLAFDDFGAGQARLLEFAEVPPDYLKFDISFIHDIDRSPESKRLVLRSLVGAATDLGVKTLAEGVETEAEAQACIDLGFTHAQGYLFGRAIGTDRL